MNPTVPKKTETNPPDGDENETGNSQQINPRPEVTIYKGDSAWPNPTEWILIAVSLLVLSTNIFVCSQVTEQTGAMKDQSEASKVQAKASVEQTRLTASALDLAKQGSVASDSISRRSIALAESSLIVAKRSAASADKSIKIQMQPRIAINALSASELGVGKEFVADFALENSGQTPAYHYGSQSLLEIVAKSEVSNVMNEVWPKKKLDGMILPAHVPITVSRSLPSSRMTSATYTSITNGDSIIVLRVRAIYIDNWDEFHEDPFRYTYAPRIKPPQFVFWSESMGK